MSRKSWIVSALALVAGIVLGGSGVAIFLLGPGGYRHGSTTTAKLAAGTAILTPSPSQVAAASPAVQPSPTAAPTSAPSPVSVPTVASTGWPTFANGIAFDAATGQLIAFGTAVTAAGNWPAPDTWVWDGTRWAEVAKIGSAPSARIGASMAYDPVHNVVVLHGGYDQHTNWANDTWAWTGTRWLQLSPTNSPPADGYVREQPMAWDAQKGVVVLINEQGNAALAANPTQTWSWDNRTWAAVPAQGAPALGIAGVQPTAVAYYTSRNVVVIFSQMNGVPRTWTFDGTKWTQVATSGTVAMNFAMAADDARSNIVAFGSGGDTWTFDGSKWTVQNPAHTPPKGDDYAMAYDPARHVVDLLVDLPSGSQTWTWEGSDWTQAG